jgi:hypothetical protein
VNIREKFGIGLEAAVGLCCAFVTLHGLWGVYGLDFRRDTLISVLYCLLPFASFFVFLWIKEPRPKILSHAAIAIGYLTTFSLLSWRTCDSVGYCVSVASTVWEVFRTKSVLAAFGALVLTGIGQTVDGKIIPAEKRS